MRWSVIVLVVVSTVLAWTCSAFAADSAESYRVAMVLWRGVTDAENGFVDYLAENNVNVVYETYDIAKDKKKLPGIIEEIKKTQPDLIYTFGTSVSTKIVGTLENVAPDKNVVDIPVVFNIVADPIGAGLVESFDSSGRNLTGTTHLVPIDVQLNAIRQVDDYKKIGVVYNPLEKNSIGTVEKLEALAEEYAYEIVKSPISIGNDGKPHLATFPEAVQAMLTQKVDLVYLPSDSYIISNAEELIDYINVFGLPTFSATEGPIRKGGALMGVVSRYYNVGKFAGYKAKQILVEGKSPADIPIETLKRFTILVNMDTAQELDYYPPVSVLRFAEVVKFD